MSTSSSTPLRAAGSLRSSCHACPPVSAANVSAPARSRSAICTATPSPARRRAIAAPIPLAPPVINAERPCSPDESSMTDILSDQRRSRYERRRRRPRLGSVVGLLAALGNAADRAVQDCGAEATECDHNRDGPYGMGDLPAITYARPVSRGSLHIPAQLLNVDRTVDDEGQQEQSERSDRRPQCDAVCLARLHDQHRHRYERR